MKFNCLWGSRTRKVVELSPLHNRPSPASTSLAWQGKVSFHVSSQNKVTRLWWKEPFAVPGMSPRGELIVQFAHSDCRVTSSSRQFIKVSVAIRNKVASTYG
jgi:hypothetical protein